MHTLTTEDFSRQPQQIIDDAQRGEASLVVRDGEPLLLSVPLGKGIESRAVRQEFAVRLYERDQISLGLAARVAGVSYAEMLDELGRRGIAVVRYNDEDMSQEIDYVRTIAGRG